MRKILKNNNASAVPVILFIMTIIGCGALYTLFFLEVGLPELEDYIPDSDAKTFIMMGIYALPLFILITGVVSLLIAGLKRYGGYGV